MDGFGARYAVNKQLTLGLEVFNLAGKKGNDSAGCGPLDFLTRAAQAKSNGPGKLPM